MSIGWPQTFGLDLDQVRRAIALYAEEPKASIQAVSSQLGIGGPKVEGLNSWLKYLGLRDPRSRELTALGVFLYRADASLSNFGTLCVLHYILCSNADATVWHEVVNHFIAKRPSFTRDDLREHFEREGIGQSSPKQLKSDIGLFVSTYNGGDRRALQQLSFLRSKGDMIVAQAVSEVHPLVLGFCLFYRLESGMPETTTSISRLLKEDSRPGLVFRLAEEDLREKLHMLESAGFLSVVRIADIDGVKYSPLSRPILSEIKVEIS